MIDGAEPLTSVSCNDLLTQAFGILHDIYMNVLQGLTRVIYGLM
jgi:hypothetical protein